MGNVNDPAPSIENNPLRGEGSGSEFHTIANAKGIYIDLLQYFKTRPDKLFVVITAPPLVDGTYADNVRAFNDWLVDGWLSNYGVGNVFVFDFYNVLTTNGGNPDVNDLGQETGNHHRWWNGQIQHKTNGDDDATPNISEYPTSDDHPTAAGNQKATAEFVPLLNYAYSHASLSLPMSSSPADQGTSAPPTSTSQQDGQENTAMPLEYIIFAAAAIVVVVVVVSILALRSRKNLLSRRPPPPPPPS